MSSRPPAAGHPPPTGGERRPPDTHDPPRFLDGLLRQVLSPDVTGRSIRGDLHQEFRRKARQSVPTARRWFRQEVLSVVARRILSPRRWAGWHPYSRTRGTRREPRKGDPMWQVLLREIRYSVRTLARAPRFTLVAVLTLALGIGATTAIFSTVNGVLLRPLPYPDSDRIVGLWHGAPDLGYDQFGISPGIFHQYREENQVYESMGLYISLERNLTEDGEAERVQATASTAGLFQVLGVPALLGRMKRQKGAPASSSSAMPSGSVGTAGGRTSWARSCRWTDIPPRSSV
jgi:hypothetical protein